jgi:hypothetical protein
MSMNRTVRLLASALVLALAYACAPAPIYKPIKAGDVDTGGNSLEAVRRQFQGTWALDNYYVYEGTRRRRLDATAELKYDEFGNLTMRGQLKNATAATSAAALMLNYTGRAVIDVNSKELRMMAVSNTGDALPSPIEAKVDPSSVRHYQFQGSELWLTVNGADGKPTASSSWKKIQ